MGQKERGRREKIKNKEDLDISFLPYIVGFSIILCYPDKRLSDMSLVIIIMKVLMLFQLDPHYFTSQIL